MDHRYTLQPENASNNRNGKNALRTNASLIMNKNGVSTSSASHITSSNNPQATPTHSSGKGSPVQEVGTDFWKRHNQVFD